MQTVQHDGDAITKSMRGPRPSCVVGVDYPASDSCDRCQDALFFISPVSCGAGFLFLGPNIYLEPQEYVAVCVTYEQCTLSNFNSVKVVEN